MTGLFKINVYVCENIPPIDIKYKEENEGEGNPVGITAIA